METVLIYVSTLQLSMSVLVKWVCIHVFRNTYFSVCPPSYYNFVLYFTPPGYELESNRKTCVVPEAFLLFARKENIGRISIENPYNDAIIPASGIKDAR